ncbi:hypothetical protein NDU88_009828 [Pleurodeles waltl]|uniref:Uncharacterized protein n=1 Tax=Pleurodeles waltl TaxID=8319 RepID=A0AAV7S253_PLEWA|nr:hypothetical protein NDU88_009828 [Pleurodeles waltl]
MHLAEPTRLPFPGRRDASRRLHVPRTKLIASRGTRLPLPGREDASLRLRVQFLAHLAPRKLSEEPLKGLRTKKEKNVTGTKNQPDKNKSPPARDTKRALHSPPARDTKRALHSSTQTSRSASTQKLHYGRVLSTSAAAPPGLHHSGSQIQHLQARNHRWTDPDEKQTEDPSGRKSVGPGLVVTPRRQC